MALEEAQATLRDFRVAAVCNIGFVQKIINLS